MYTIYKLKADDLDSRFLRALKALFKNKEIEIVVSEASEIEEEETAYLLKSQTNRDRLLKALDNVVHNRNLVTVNLDLY